MTPFSFANPAQDWKRFCEEAGKWKPVGFDREMALRLAYYLDQQIEDTKAEMRKRFPETNEKMLPVTLPIVRHFVREQAKVFLQTMKLDLVNEDGSEVAKDLAAWWGKTKERMGLGLRLKRTDGYTVLLRTAGLKIGHVEGRFVAHVVFPHNLRVVMDPEAPMDLDRAWGVALEIASEAGLNANGSGARRWEFWCAREDSTQHFILEDRGQDDVTITSRDEGDLARRPDGRPMVPIVLFTAHTEELGLFTLEGADLVPVNRALNLLVTDIHHIAEQQGFGVMVVTTPAGENAPAKIVRAPNTAISLQGGADAKFINPQAPIADLLALANARIKQSVLLHGIPPGSVSLEARAVASGIALQVEMRPLLEIRADAIEVYRDPMRRLWEVLRAVHNLFAGEANADAPKIDDGTEMRWTPGEIQPPVDELVKVESVIAKLGKRLMTRAEAIAELRGIPLDEAKEVAARIDKEDPKPDPALQDPLGLGGRRAALLGGPPDREGAAPPA